MDKSSIATLKTFMGPAYIREIEPGLYEMYRDIMLEENGVREKFGKSIGPIMVLRPANKGEKVDFMSSTPDGKMLELHRIDSRKPELEEMMSGMKWNPNAGWNGL